MSPPKQPPINSDRPEQAASTGKPQTPVYDSRITNNPRPVQASFTGQERITNNDQSPMTNNERPTTINDQRSTTNEQPTTNHEPRITNTLYKGIGKK